MFFNVLKKVCLILRALTKWDKKCSCIKSYKKWKHPQSRTMNSISFQTYFYSRKKSPMKIKTDFFTWEAKWELKWNSLLLEITKIKLSLKLKIQEPKCKSVLTWLALMKNSNRWLLCKRTILRKKYTINTVKRIFLWVKWKLTNVKSLKISWNPSTFL